MSNNIGKNIHIYTFSIDEYDTMATTMIYHFLEAWEHLQFNQLLLSKLQMWNYTIELHTFILRGTLGSSMTYSMFLVVRVDDTCVANMMHNVKHLPLVQPYMVAIQNTNNNAMNEAINGFYLKDEDYD
jgi:clathrin heavy chain